jgi:hypothetical protein
MTLSRRTVVKLGLGAGAGSLLPRVPVAAQEVHPGALNADHATVLARPLPLSAVRLTGGPLKRAQDLDAAYLLELDPDRMMAYYRDRAGLARRAEPYGGWDGGGRNLTGHIAGHYLSAVSLMWAATGDARFKERADYLVADMKEVQDAHGDGYLVALEGGRRAFSELARGEIRSAAFDLNGEWSPWYTLHKTYAGLRDAYRYTGNRTALDVEVAFAAWAEGVLAHLSEAQLQRMMNTEFGGMGEIMVDLYADTGDERWLALSYRFEHTDFTRPLQHLQDNLAGKHGNTQVPKLVGSADRYAYTGRAADLVAADFFWKRVAHHHSFATGGHGTDEYFGPADRLNDRVDGRTAETCNVYNMLKLTRRLFSLLPDPVYADFHERALFNHILASMDPEDGRTCYMVPVGRGVTHEYQNMTRGFTCCVGSGMESHALHGDGLYYEAEGRVWVNLYAPSTAEWTAAGVRLAMETDFPEGESARLTVTAASPREFTLALRRPHWSGEGFAVSVNGQAVDVGARASEDEEEGWRGLYAWDFPVSSYVDIRRTWRSGDEVRISLPKALRLEALPDNARRASVLWGPLVLAGDLGPEPEGRRDEEERLEPPVVPVFVREEGAEVSSWLRPVTAGSGGLGGAGRFRSAGAGREPNADGAVHDIDFVPFYQLHRRTYSTYWDLFTPEEWAERKTEYAARAERLRRLEAATVAWVQPGEVVFERDFGYQGGEDATAARIEGRPGRRGRSWFSYEVPVDPGHPTTLILTFFSDDRRSAPATFDVLVDGHVLATQEVGRTEPREFFDVEHPVPGVMVAGKARVTVRFQAHEGSQIATLFGVRVIRGDAAR